MISNDIAGRYTLIFNTVLVKVQLANFEQTRTNITNVFQVDAKPQ